MGSIQGEQASEMPKHYYHISGWNPVYVACWTNFLCEHLVVFYSCEGCKNLNIQIGASVIVLLCLCCMGYVRVNPFKWPRITCEWLNYTIRKSKLPTVLFLKLGWIWIVFVERLFIIFGICGMTESHLSPCWDVPSSPGGPFDWSCAQLLLCGTDPKPTPHELIAWHNILLAELEAHTCVWLVDK